MFEQLDPEKWAKVMEHHLGRPGRILFSVTLICVCLGISAFALTVLFNDFLGNVIWPFFAQLIGGKEGAITLDNIETVILVLTATIGVLLFLLVMVAMIVMRAIRRRVVTQAAIDELAEMRSRGISVLNNRPSEMGGFDKWTATWESWRNEVIAVLQTHFTRAELLSFSRLGVIREQPFGMAESPEHQHSLMMLSKQLSILEMLIQRHQDRR